MKASRFGKGNDTSKGVFCFPVQADFFATHQWVRELRRRSRAMICGVYFRVPDAEAVQIGRFGKKGQELRADEALTIAHNNSLLGWEVVVPRSIAPSEIIRIKKLPQIIGWRLYPEAKGTRPVWPTAGTFGASKMRDAITESERLEEDRYFSRFPAEWYSDQGSE
ncbi:hypothetical protein [Asticcacaulis sp. MM231]|uniref:hypothetical protein n=1 Tax=Asticcacaulis sp. MM231 TaxID=3157666 RepID=UPI0032D57251